MRLINFCVENYRSIVNSGDIRTEPLQAFVGENNAVNLDIRLEDALQHDGHLRKAYAAKKIFEDSNNITESFKEKVRELFS